MIKIISYIITLLAALDIFNYYFTTYLSGFSFYLLLFIPFFIVLFNIGRIKSTVLHKKQLLYLTIWVIVHIINNQMISNYSYSNNIFGLNINIITLQTFQIFCIFTIYYYIDNISKNKHRNRIIQFILFSFFIDAVISLVALRIDPNIAKIMATGKLELNINNLKGVSGYSTIYSIVIIMPLLLSYLMLSRQKLFSTLYISTLIYFVYKSAFATALIVLVLGILMFFFLNMKKNLRLILLPFIFLTCLILINPDLIYRVLIEISMRIEIYELSARFEQIANLIKYNNDSGAALYRLVLYRQSIEAFLKYPITGVFIFEPNYALSGHSAILDILGGTGLIGFIPYILFIWNSYKISLSKTDNYIIKSAIKSSYMLIMIISIVNTLTNSFAIVLIILFFINWFPDFVKNKTTYTTRFLN